RLRALGLASRHARHFTPHFNNALRSAAYAAIGTSTPPAHPDSLSSMVAEFEVMAEFRRDNPNDATLQSGSGPMFDADDVAMLEFLNPAAGSGPTILRAYLPYHSPNAGDFIAEILELLDRGRTVILDLGNATDEIRRYFSDMLSSHVFRHSGEKVC